MMFYDSSSSEQSDLSEEIKPHYGESFELQIVISDWGIV